MFSFYTALKVPPGGIIRQGFDRKKFSCNEAKRQELFSANEKRHDLGDGEPSVYVGTYGKYNDGSLCGLWIDLSTFND